MKRQTENKWVQLKAECGAPIWIDYDSAKKSAAIGALVLAGGCDEHWPKEAGLAHAMEHMVFQGTKNFKNNKELTEQIEDVGGDLNAETGLDRTFFFSILPIKFARRGFIHLNEMLLNPLLKPVNIEKEMKNIIQELKLYQDDPQAVASELFMDAICGKHPFARPEIGTQKAISSFRREDFLKWKDKFYYPENFTFIIAGGLDPQKAKSFIDEIFPKSAITKAPNNRIMPASLIGKTPRFLFAPRNDWKQAKILIGTTIEGSDSAEVKAIKLFAAMISDMSGPLFQEIRDKRGLAYQAHVETQSFNPLSIFTIYVGTDTSKHGEVIDTVHKVFSQSKNSRELFEKTKTKVLGYFALRSDFLNPKSIVQSSAISIVIRGKPITLKEREKEIQSITLEQVEAAVNKYLNPDKLTAVVVGPEMKK